MGKSPGKWIKGMLFGKKASKSNSSKGTKLSKSASEKPVRVSTLEPEPTLIVNAPLISNPLPSIVTDTKDNSGFENVEAPILPSDEIISSSMKQDEDIMSTVSDPGQTNVTDSGKIEQAAIVVQASFRSYQVMTAFLYITTMLDKHVYLWLKVCIYGVVYLMISKARREFRSLKGIIKIQAIVRGRLVRRQAIATFLCVQGVVKFQAIARGHMVRRSSTANEQGKKRSLVSKDAEHQDSSEVKKHNSTDTSLKKAFIKKVALSPSPGLSSIHSYTIGNLILLQFLPFQLLSSSPTAMPLRLQYGSGEPNFAWEWLLRWSTSQVWASNRKQSETRDFKLETVEKEESKPKSSGGKVLGNGSEIDNLKHNTRKVSSQPLKSTQEHSQTGNDKLKRGLKKTSKTSGEKSTEAKVDVEKPKKHPKKLSKSPAPKLSEEFTNTSDKPIENSEEALSNNIIVESSLEANSRVCEKSQDSFPVEKGFKDDKISKENYKSSRRNSLPAKHDNREASPESVTRVPSYMARTASSKAKVKAVDSPRFGQDAADKNALTRRHSLSSFVYGKDSSSPRVQRLVQSNGKGGIKIDRSLSSSRDVTGKSMHIFLF
ncbi:hypothetical protein RD792_012516 [Penstemon davidsonii]|uniref:DUF4005 domain-containing protein n=1 Tax=Penstemon davidsonii TaxID=160366 RepID=A0ABR0CX34_9LAMI|nr:hypothetical protein RD792_012516 [Penstemon davidsonii]